jgi:hypothetical protein
MATRVAAVGDPWADIHQHGRSLDAAIEQLARI